MQTLGFLQIVGMISIIIGICIVCIAFSKMRNSSDISKTESKVQNKGIILIGPIPIVWGYGKRGWAVAGIIGIALFIIIFLLLN